MSAVANRPTKSSAEKHTKGEWQIRKQDVVCEDEPGLFVYVIENEAGMLFTLDKGLLALAKSIVAAHNNTYAAGLNPSAVPGLVKALEYYRNKEKSDSGGIVDETTPANTALADAKKVEE